MKYLYIHTYIYTYRIFMKYFRDLFKHKSECFGHQDHYQQTNNLNLFIITPIFIVDNGPGDRNAHALILLFCMK